MKQQINTPGELLTAICNELGCNETKIKSKCRKQELVNVRHIYAYIGKIYFDFTLMSLSTEIGNRDHTTMIHSITAVKTFLSCNDKMITEMLAIVMTSLGLTESDRKNYEHLLSQYNDLQKLYSELKLKYANSCADNLFLIKKIEILERQIKLYKSNALIA
jgi:hypothetical protein